METFMKKTIVLLMLLVSAVAFAEDPVLKFGIAPSNPNSRESMNVFVKFLAERTGRAFELVQFDVEELLGKLASGEVAFADLSSSAYATAIGSYKDRIRYVATVAARNEKGELVPYYKGLFFALKDNPCNTMLDLKGKSFAFVSRNSTSGYVYPLAALNAMGIDPDTFFGTLAFAGDHSKIFEGLKTGFLDAGVSNYEAYDKAKAMYGNIFKIIGETAEIPSGAIVASATVDGDIIKKVQEALVSIKPADPVVNYPGFLYKGFIKKGGGFYDLIKKLIGKFY